MDNIFKQDWINGYLEDNYKEIDDFINKVEKNGPNNFLRTATVSHIQYLLDTSRVEARQLLDDWIEKKKGEKH